MNAAAYKKKSAGDQKVSAKGIWLSLAAGLLMSFFYRFIAASMDIENFVAPAAGKMTPYTAVFIFSVGIFISNFSLPLYYINKYICIFIAAQFIEKIII